MRFTGMLGGLALIHLESLDCYTLGNSPGRDEEVVRSVLDAVDHLPAVTRIPVQLVLSVATTIVRLRTGTTLDLLSADRRRREFQVLRRVPLVAMVDKLVVNVTYLNALGVHPRAGEAPK